MNYRELKALARRADRAKCGERKRLVGWLIRELPKLDPFEGFRLLPFQALDDELLQVVEAHEWREYVIGDLDWGGWLTRGPGT